MSVYGRALISATFLFFVSVSVSLSFAETRPAFIKTEFKKNGKIWPGQRQTLYVKLYTTTSFAGSTRFELPGVSGMLIMESEDRPLLGTEKIDGVSYIFKQHEITLFPQRAGSLIFPPFEVEFGFRGAESKVVEQSFTTSELQFTVEKIPGTDPGRPVVTTSNLHVDDHWEPVPGKARVGDAFTRTITMIADDLPGMAFPPLRFGEIDGLGIYSKQPRVEDQMQRGDFTGKRIETITYVCEQTGTFTIPATGIQWWNPQAETLQNVTLEPVTFTVAANPLLEKEGHVDASQATPGRFPWKGLTLLLFSGLVVTALFLQHRRKLRHSSQPMDEEKTLFEQFHKATGSRDAEATMRALLHWLDYSGLSGSTGSLARFSMLAADPQLDKQIELLETAVYAEKHGEQWSGELLYTAVQRARKKLKHQNSTIEKCSLPALNP